VVRAIFRVQQTEMWSSGK